MPSINGPGARIQKGGLGPTAHRVYYTYMHTWGSRPQEEEDEGFDLPARLSRGRAHMDGPGESRTHRVGG